MRQGFDRSVPLPPHLTCSHIERAIDWIESELDDFVDVYFEQANVFSALVGIFAIRALTSFTPYRRHKHPDIAQQRFPDLSLKGKLNPPPNEALESKGSTRTWALQSHYDHPGWYIVWRYMIDRTRQINPGRQVVIWRVDVALLRKQDWKYEGSKAKEGQGGRTHTFGLKLPAKRLRDAAAFRHPNVEISRGVPTLAG